MTTGLPFPRRLWAIFSLSLGSAMVVADGAMPNVALPTMAKALHVDNSAIVMVVTVYQLVLVMTVMPFSNLGERIGYRRLYVLGLTGFFVATAWCFVINNLVLLLLVRAAQAMCAGATLGVSIGMLRLIYPERRLGRGLGVNAIVVSTAAAVSPTVGGLILSVATWPWVLTSVMPFALLSLSLSKHLPDDEPRAHAFDVVAAIECAAMLGLSIGGLEGLVHGGSPYGFGGLILLGIVVGRLFVRREIGNPRAILPIDLLGRPIVALSVAGAFAAFMAAQTLILSLPFRLQQQFGFSAAQVGAMLAPWPLTVMVVAPMAGALSDSYPAGALGALGMVCFGLGMASLAWLPNHPSYWDVAWRMVLSGGGFGLYMSPNARLIIGAASPRRAGAAGGLVATTRLTGQTCGATLAAALFAFGVGIGPTPALAAVGLAILAALCSIARLKSGIRDQPIAGTSVPMLDGSVAPTSQL